MRTEKAVVSIMLAALFCVSCSSMVLERKEAGSSVPKSVAFKQIASSTHSGFARPEMGIITAQKEWDEFRTKLYMKISPPPSQDSDLIDFSREMVIYVAIGERSNGCYGVKIASVTAMQDGKLKVTYDENVPDKGCICPQVITTPVDAVKIEKITKNGTPPEFIRNVVVVSCP